MVRKLSLGLMVAILCGLFIGCGEKPTDHRDELAAKAAAAMEELKAERLKLGTTMAQLEDQVARIQANLAYLEQVHKELYGPKEDITFWNTLDWVGSQANILILLLFVVWLLYSLNHRRKRPIQP
ncbi:MAG: hypothetical protein KKA60_15410 [Proteobacteria bacterium]|nr:hypothetical protein [Pseudomonadota bacterium]